MVSLDGVKELDMCTTDEDINKPVYEAMIEALIKEGGKWAK